MPELSYESMVSDGRESPPRVVVEREGAHATVTMDDPERLNPLSGGLTVSCTTR